MSTKALRWGMLVLLKRVGLRTDECGDKVRKNRGRIMFRYKEHV